MGILDKILLAPVRGPIDMVIWLGEKVMEQVDRELYDEDAVRGKLMELELRYDLEEIDEQEYMRGEQELLERLSLIHERRKEQESQR